MATDSPSRPQQERAEFGRFVTERLVDDLEDASIEQGVARFRAYQRDLSRLKERVAAAQAEALCGAIRTIDPAETWRGLGERLSRRGTSP